MSLLHVDQMTDAELAELNQQFERQSAGSIIRWAVE
ncbi:MAG: hypothetical protein QOG64_2676, partial [Acidimicrobiaceae bacterium]|nr:hypothetical protein [Acidimicrobiaceae bacterium]